MSTVTAKRQLRDERVEHEDTQDWPSVNEFFTDLPLLSSNANRLQTPDCSTALKAGHQNRMGSLICLTESDAVKARGFKRLEVSERFLKGELDKVKG